MHPKPQTQHFMWLGVAGRAEVKKKNPAESPERWGDTFANLSVADRYHEHFVHREAPGTMQFNRFFSEHPMIFFQNIPTQTL